MEDFGPYFALAAIAAFLFFRIQSLTKALQDTIGRLIELEVAWADKAREWAVLLEELDARIKRLKAREDYWRLQATSRPQEDPPEEPTESPLSLRNRLRGQ